MSHIAIPHIAAWLSDPDGDYAVGALLQSVPRYGTDAIPETPVIYNDYEHDWAALGLLPDTDDELAEIAITTPLLAVKLLGEDSVREPYAQPSSNRAEDDLLRVGVLIAIRSTSPAANARALSYYARVVKNSLRALGFASDTDRTVVNAGVRLGRVQSMSRGSGSTQKGDLLADTTLVVAFAMTESTAVPA
jgi:hypothetical protein